MEESNTPQHNDIIFYNTSTGNVKTEVLYREESFWLTQKRMAELFGVEVPAINKHLSNIYETGELEKIPTISILETVQQEGRRMVKRNVEFYNLDAIIAIGYRVNSHQATQFRIWATKILREFIIKGFVLDDERPDWVSRLDAFLQFNEYQILDDAGKVSHAVALKLAEKAYDTFRVIQDRHFESDFDKEIKRLADKLRRKE